MKILYIHQYFETPDENGTTRSYWFAKKLVEKGHQVKMITSTHDTTKRTAGLYNIEGIEVRYVACKYANEMSKIRRLFSFFNFMLAALWYVLKERNVDIIYATSTPLTVGLIALLSKKLRRTKYIFEVRDLWPAFPIEIGAVRNKLLIKILKYLEVSIYKCANFIVALSPGMQQGIIKCGISINKTIVIPNMSKPDIFYPRDKSKEVIERWKIKEANFNLIHFGAMGIANGLEYIIETARILQNENVNDVHFYFLGSGTVKIKLKEMVASYNLNNVHFIERQNTYLTSEIVNCCDVTITSFRNIPVLRTNSPNKLFDSLSAGKPVVVNSSGWTKELIEKYKCGFYVDPNSPRDFANKIIDYKNKKELLDLFGKNAREISLKVFDKNILTEQFVNIIEKSI